MGMKARPHRGKWYKERIKVVNDQLDGLMKEKDRLIDHMRASCGHRRLIEAPPDENGRGPVAKMPVRSCLDCGETEFTDDEWCTLVGKARVIDRSELAAKLGRTLKRIGVDL